MRPNSRNRTVELLRLMIEEGYSKKAWHGPNLRGAIRGVTCRQAARRPGPGRHNIWEIVVHTAYWKYIVLRRVFADKKFVFPLKGHNWFRRPLVLTARAWNHDVALLHETHRELAEAVSRLRDSDLKKIKRRGKHGVRSMLWGIAAHDVYHAGQIQLIKRLHGI
ncbi:MAG TPA: DinB family protein [Bacteroidota bacterium]|nr:DinB family protein [Bacteroidota bacterium]